MLSDFRAFLESELKLLGNASHHAYSFGQANMAKRALERLDAEVAEHVPLLLPIADAQAALAALEAEAAPDSTLDPALARVRDLLRAALVAPA
jgi:NAD(P)H-dependent FMN reductase